MSNERNNIKYYSPMTNPLAILTRVRHSYEKLLNARAAIKELEDDEYCNGAFGRFNFEITIKRLDKSIDECENDLRAAEKQYFGV